MESEIKKISRYGAYGIVVDNDQLLLTLKTAGPYKGLWDLPGGGIEFGETPEAALHRELHEEVALTAKRIELLTVMTNCEPNFHHIGIIYRVHEISTIEGNQPEDELRWMPLNNIIVHELTPFAKQAWERKLIKK